MSEQEFETLAAEFIERHRMGEQPSVDEYASRFPDMAEEIRELFPTMVALERLKEKKQQAAPAHKKLGTLSIQQLGDYRIVREIGRGGMGIVYEAEQLSLGRRVAVKVLPKQSLLQAQQLQRFQREAATAAKLHHTNIVPVFGVGHDDGYHYIVMQFIDGVGLDEIIHQLRGWLVDDPTDAREHAFSIHAERSSQASEGARSLLDDHFESPSSDRSQDQFETVALAPQETLVEAAPSAPSSLASNPGETSSRLGEPLGPKYWRSVARLGQQAATAVAYAHEQGTLHRDVKPSNLLLDTDGHLWIADFGLAKASEQQDEISRTGDIVGTLAYMAPEQLSGKSDARSDVYSLGVTLYELLTLHPAMSGKSYSEMLQQINEGRIVAPRKSNPETPRDLETVVLKAVAREPRDRYASAAELADDLQRFLDDRPVAARRASRWEHAARWCRRNPLAASLVGAVAMLVLALLGVLSVAYGNAQRTIAVEQEEQKKTRDALTVTIDILDEIHQQIAPDRVSASNWGTSNADESFSSGAAALNPATVTMMARLIQGYERLAEIDSDNRDLQIRAASARRRAGEIQMRLGKLQEAQATLQKATLQFAKLAKADGPHDYLVETASIHNALGEISWRQQERSGRDEHLAALKLLEAAEKPATAPKELQSRAARFELARTLYLLGRRMERPADLGSELPPVGRGPEHGPGPEGRGPDRRPPPGGRRPGDLGPGGPGRGGPGGPGRGGPGRGGPGRGPGRGGLGPGSGGPAPRDRRPPRREPPPLGGSSLEREATHWLAAAAHWCGNQAARAGVPAQLNQLAWDLFAMVQPPRDFRGPLPGARDGRPPLRPGQRFGGAGPLGPFPRMMAHHHPPENIAYLKRAIAVLQSLEKEQEGNPEVTRLRALCHRELAESANTAHLDLALKLFEQLHEDNPNVADYAFDLARAYLTHVSSGPAGIQPRLAIERLEKSRKLLEKLSQDHPSVLEYAGQLAFVLLEQANMATNSLPALRREQWDRIRSDLATARRLQKQVIKLNPSPFQHSALAAIEYRYAEACFANGSVKEAAGVLTESIERLEAFQEAISHRHHRALIADRLRDSRDALAQTQRDAE